MSDLCGIINTGQGGRTLPQLEMFLFHVIFTYSEYVWSTLMGLCASKQKPAEATIWCQHQNLVRHGGRRGGGGVYLQVWSSSSAIYLASLHSRSPKQSHPASAGAARGRPSLCHQSSLKSTETHFSLNVEYVFSNSPKQKHRLCFLLLSCELSAAASPRCQLNLSHSRTSSVMFTVKLRLQRWEPPTEAAR